MDKKQEDKNTEKKKSDLINKTISMVLLIILIVGQMICIFHGVSKYVIAAFEPCAGLILLPLVLKSNSHGIKKVVGIIGVLILIVVLPLTYILTN